MPTITQLKYVVSVDQWRNFSRAAEECHVSQPSLSAQIQKVEEELDIIIFDRTKKPVATTIAGQEVVNQAKSILKEHARLFEIGNDSGVLSGQFRLAVIPSLASSTIPLFVESFSSKYPKVELEITESKTEDIIRFLDEGSIDAGLLVTPLNNHKIIEKVLFYERFYVFTSKNHELFHKKTLREEDLDPSSIWLLEEGHCFRDQVIRVCSLDRKNSVLDNVQFASGSLETLIHLIRRGRGYTLLPELATLSLTLQEKEQNLKKFRSPIPTREVSLVFPRNALKQSIIEALQEEIVTHLPKSLRSIKKEKVNIIDI